MSTNVYSLQVGQSENKHVLFYFLSHGKNRSSSHDLRNADQKGLLWMLDEEALFPGANDDSFMERLYIHFSDEVSKRKD